MIGVKSEDVGFHWDTNMFMLTIIIDFAKAESDEDIERSMRYYRNGDMLWDRVQPHLEDIKKLVCDIESEVDS